MSRITPDHRLSSDTYFLRFEATSIFTQRDTPKAAFRAVYPGSWQGAGGVFEAGRRPIKLTHLTRG